MVSPPLPDPAAALREFLARVTPYDPGPPEPVVSLAVRGVDREDETIELTGYVVRALCEALWRYQDPKDCGPCDHCGRRGLDEHLRCPHCGTVNGIFGETLARHALKVRREGGSDPAALTWSPTDATG